MNQTKDLTILKIGGSVITNKKAESGVFLEEEMKRIAEEISFFKKPLVLVHGVGSFGHPLAHKYNLTKEFDSEGLTLTHESVQDLNRKVVRNINEVGLKAVGINPIDCFVSNGGRILSGYLDSIKLMLDKGIIPVLYGDVVMDAKQGNSIVSGDQLVSYLAPALGAKRIGLGSIEEGVLDKEGDIIKKITPNNFEEIVDSLGGSYATDVTGGMLGKVTETLDMCQRNSLEAYIFNAKNPGNVEKFLKGESVGTVISSD